MGILPDTPLWYFPGRNQQGDGIGLRIERISISHIMPILPAYGAIPARDCHVRFARDLILPREKENIEKAVGVSGRPSLPDDIGIFSLDAQTAWKR
jgi:hypothetical protein